MGELPFLADCDTVRKRQIYEAVFSMLEWQIVGTERGFHSPAAEKAQDLKIGAFFMLCSQDQVEAVKRAQVARDELYKGEHRIGAEAIEELFKNEGEVI